MVCLQRRSQHPPSREEENTRAQSSFLPPQVQDINGLEHGRFFFLSYFSSSGGQKEKSREDHPKRYIGKNEKQENRMGEREIKREINVLLEYLFTIWESHRIDHIRRRRLVDSKAGCVFF
jgi:hypothetical protein